MFLNFGQKALPFAQKSGEQHLSIRETIGDYIEMAVGALASAKGDVKIEA